MDALGLFHRYRDDVYRLAVNYTSSPREAEDVSRSVFLKLAAREDVDAVLVAGDMYNRAQPQPECISMFSRFLSRLRALGKPAFFVRGNHDGEAQLAYASELLSEVIIGGTGSLTGCSTARCPEPR